MKKILLLIASAAIALAVNAAPQKVDFGKLPKNSQEFIQKKYGTGAQPIDFVFHGGSGSTLEEIREAISYGVIKMNIDTDTQYAFTRPIADHVFENYDKVLKIDGEVGEKKFYDPRSWGRKAEDSMSARVVEACRQLGSAGKALK